ncbi:hypothetical protein Aperf_G00000045673 [Anoplocephala perfoliata]
MPFRFQPERALRRLQVAAVNADLEHKSTVCRITYLVLMTMAVLFLVGSVVLLAIYFASADLVVSFVGSSDNSDSLSGGLSSSSKKIAEFFEEGIEGGKEKTNAAVKNLVDQAKIEVDKGLSENIDSLLEYLQIPQTLQYGKSSLNELKTARDKADKTLNLQTLKEAFEKYEEDIDKLKNEYKGKLNCQPQSDSGCPDIDICVHLSIEIAFGFIATIIASIQMSNGRLCPNGIAIAPERALRRLQVAAVNADLEHKSTVCRIIYLVFMTMAVLFLVGSVVLLAIYFASADLVVSFVGSSDNSDSLSGGLKSSSKKIAEFFEEGIEGGKEKTNAAVKNLVDQAKIAVDMGLSESIDSLLEYLQIPQTLQCGELSLNELKSARDKANTTLTNLRILNETFEKCERVIINLKKDYNKCPDIEKLESPVKLSNLDLELLEAYKSALGVVVCALEGQLDEVNKTLERSFEFR